MNVTVLAFAFSIPVSAAGSPQQQPPILSSISPSSGTVGTAVIIHGAGFTETDNTVNFGIGGTKNISSGDGTIIKYTIPAAMSVCDLLGRACRAATMPVNPGRYELSVSNANGRTRPLSFTVTKTRLILSVLRPPDAVPSMQKGNLHLPAMR